MPRTIAVDCPGCQSFNLRRAWSDQGHLIPRCWKSRASSYPNDSSKLGEPDASRCVLSASINDSRYDPLLALARKNGHVSVSFNQNCSIFSLLIVIMTRNDSPTTWNVCTSGDVLCSAVDGNESHAIFGGKGIEVNLWNLEKCSKIWAAKPPPKNNLDIFTPTWFTAATFLGEEDHRKIVAGTNNHQVRLYDVSAQRRPVISVDFRESPIKAVTGDPDGHTIYFGTGSGDLASVDIRTGKVLGCFLGKCSGSIRSIVRHPELPLIVSCGLDRYLRFWNVKTRQLLSAVFLKQHLTSIVIDSNFSDEVPAVAAVNPPANEEQVDLSDYEDDTSPQLKKKKSSKEGKQKRKSKKTSNVTVEDNNCIAVNSPSDEEELTNLDQDEDDASPPVKKKKALKEDKQNKKSKKKSKATVEDEDYSTAGNSRSDDAQVRENEVEDGVSPPVKRKKALKEGKQNKKLESKKKSKKTVVDEDD